MAGPSTQQNATIYEGEDITLTFTVSGIDATTATAITYTVGPVDNPYISKSLSGGIAATNSTTITVTLDAADSLSLAGCHHHELRVTNASSKVAVAAVGLLTINQTTDSASPVSSDGENITITQGDTFTDAEGLGAKILITKKPGEDWPTSLSGYTITLGAELNTDNEIGSGGTASFSWTGTAVTSTGNGQSVKFNGLSGTGSYGVGRSVYDWTITATKSGSTQSLRHGTLTVLDRKVAS